MAGKKHNDSKESLKKGRPTVNIRKLKVNYELRFDFDKMLTTYISSLPYEHRKTFKNSIIDGNGKVVDEWVRSIREVQIGNIISFLIDNSYPFVLENFTHDEMMHLKKDYADRQLRIADSLRLKAQNLDVSGEDYSFMKIQPYEYQKQAVKFFEINDGVAILGDEQGVGKSCSAFSYAAKHKLKTLIICPASLKFNWRNEIQDFTQEKAFIYKYKPKKRSSIIAHSKEESLFHIINYEALASFIKPEYKHTCKGRKIAENKNCGYEIIDLVKKHKVCPNCQNANSFRTRINGIQFFQLDDGSVLDPSDYDLIVIDEFHRIKEKKTEWTQIIRQGLREIPKKILLSGTAIKSRPFEFFVSLNYLNPKEWNDQHAFGVKFGAGYESNFGWVYEGASNLDVLYERLSSVFLRRLKKDVLKHLPPKTYSNIPLELTAEEEKQYAKLLADCVKVVDGKEVEETFLVKVNKLKLFTGKIKMARMVEYIQDIIDSGEKVVVMSDFQELAEEVYKTFGDRAVLHTGSMKDVDKQLSVDRFQKDKQVQVFAGMVLASGVGITLTAACKLIFLGYAWTSSEMAQAEDRIHRASTTHDNIQIITPYFIDTIDEDIMALLKEKEIVVSQVLDNTSVINKNTSEVEIGVLKQLAQRLRK